MSEESMILTVNVGSSSLKVSLHSDHFSPLKGTFQRVGTDHGSWKLELPQGEALAGEGPLPNIAATLEILGEWLERLDGTVTAVAHRIVHGGPELMRHCVATDETIEMLSRARALAPEHVPAELDLLHDLRTSFSEVPHVLCFDTVFHTTLPEAAYTLPLPERITKGGVRRYGFHGLSYEYLVDWLRERGEVAGRSLLAHLGNGSSMAAVRDGQSVDTTMGFTPADGLVMATRTGALDPGLFRYLSNELGLEPKAVDRLVNHESGMLGISGISGDVRELLESPEPRAALALTVYARAARKHLCALAGVLGGLDRMVFTGGIGEHSVELRAAMLTDLSFLGVKLEAEANEAARTVISAPDSAIKIFVVPANEEAAMVQITRELLA